MEEVKCNIQGCYGGGRDIIQRADWLGMVSSICDWCCTELGVIWRECVFDVQALNGRSGAMFMWCLQCRYFMEACI